ncbi:MAG TPA: zinc ABC transporter substrate-binding protein [Sphaerochaetaceae bacterium]|nr:zinc ABC transporter substrate-binding protein [Sphaerochaetaceae bacterium]
MKRTAWGLITSLLLLSLLYPLSARGTSESEPSGSVTPRIAVSIVPQQYVVDRIAGDLAETVVLVGPGQSPHSYEPTPRQMASLSQAHAWITSGTEFEIALRPKISSMYSSLTIVDGTKGVTFRSMEEHHHEEEAEDDHHDHHEEEHHHDGEIDRHTWLGREPMKIMAQHVADTLISIDPTHTDIYQRNLHTFHTEIDTLFDRLTGELAPLAGSTVFVYHPSFGYLLDEFDIHQRAVETGGKEPTARALSNLILEARDAQPEAIFVQAQFPTQAARTVAETIGAQVLPLDPLAYDWITNIESIGETLQRTVMPSPQGGAQ